MGVLSLSSQYMQHQLDCMSADASNWGVGVAYCISMLKYKNGFLNVTHKLGQGRKYSSYPLFPKKRKSIYFIFVIA